MTTDPDLLYAVLRQDFASFASRALLELENRTPRPGPHIDTICDALVRVKNGEHRRLVINQPPRTLKSFLSVVAFTAWMLGHRPELKTIIACHDARLAEAHSDKVRQLLRSDFYAATFPRTRLRADFSSRDYFQTEAGGQVLAISLGGGVTGHGADLLIVDDPLDAGRAGSAAERNLVNSLFADKLVSRLNSQVTGMVLVVQQRLHTDDLSGYLQAQGGYRHLVVPLIAEEACEHRLTDGVWRRAAGDVIDPDEHPPAVIEDLRRNPAVFAAQYQQAPRPEGEALVRANCFGVFSSPPLQAQRHVLSIDTAMKASGGSYSVCLVFKTDGKDHYLVDVWRERVDYASLEVQTKALAARYSPALIVIEDAAFGGALKTVMEPFAPGKVLMVKPRGSKLERLQGVVDTLNAGRVHLPDYAVFKGEFLAEVCAFPGSANDDQVDALSQYLQAMKEVGPQWLVPKVIASGVPLRQPHPMRDPRNIHMNYAPVGRLPTRRR